VRPTVCTLNAFPLACYRLVAVAVLSPSLFDRAPGGK
jgi:hypothetical protein